MIEKPFDFKALERAIRSAKYQPDAILTTEAGAYAAHVKYGEKIYRKIDGRWQKMECLMPEQTVCTHKENDNERNTNRST